MNNNINELKQLFFKIKNKGLNKSLREKSTGLGYTFETLVDKKEDNTYQPDFKGIEIKTKLGYTKSPLTLFCLTPKKDDIRCAEYLVNNFGYKIPPKIHKSFRTDVFMNKNNVVANRYIIKSKIDYKENKLKLIILDKKLNIIENEIFWNLDEIKNRLITKLSYLAYIIGYPYKKENITYYKYTNLYIYKLKNFDVFLKLLEKDIIYITFNIGYYESGSKFGRIHDRGTAFRLSNNSISKLFSLIDKF